jgi:hypothetical protein
LFYVFGGNQVVHSRELEGLEPEVDLNQTPAGFEGGTVSEADMQSGTPMGGTLQDVVVTNSSSGSKYTNTGNYTNCGYSGEASLSNGVTNDSGNKTFRGIFDGQLEYYAKNPGPNPYSPSCDWRYSAAICASPAIVVAAEAGAIYAAGSYLFAGASEMTLGTSLYGIGINTFTQAVANSGTKGGLGEINIIESLSSAIPGIGPTIFGEYFSLKVSELQNGIFIPSKPDSLNQGILQIGGGLLSNKFGNMIDSMSVFAKGVGKVYGEMAKTLIETGTNVLPKLSE